MRPDRRGRFPAYRTESSGRTTQAVEKISRDEGAPSRIPRWTQIQAPTRYRSDRPRGLDKRYEHLRFSNRPFGVKRFQTIHPSMRWSMSLTGSCFSSESALGPFHHGIRRRGGTISWAALPSVRWQVQADIRTHLIHRPARDIIPLGGALVFSYRVILNGFHAAAAACSRVQRNSVPATQMRCMITASRRAKATIAFFIPRRLAICMAQALSQDHFRECIMLCAAS